jgi:D-alanyl-D-alanine carboxypeptidase (penicillin-binding protein 5/6)
VVKLLIILSLISNLFGLNLSSNTINNRISSVIKADASNAKPIYNSTLPNISPLPEKVNAKANALIYAKNYLLIEEASNEILASQNENDRVPIASTTKITSSMVIIENYNLDQVVEVSAKAAGQIGSDTNLISGEKMTVRNLLYCMLIMSGNDAAYALAENFPGGVQKFVDEMNAKAASLSMKNTHYLDPAGLNPDAYSSAYDLSIITRYALKNKTFAGIVATPQITVDNTAGTRHHDLKNSNRLVNDYNYPGAIGVKTGYLPESGHCLVGAADRNGHRLIAVILNTNSTTPTASATEARKLLDFGFNNYQFN